MFLTQFKKISQKAGLPPGSLVHIGEPTDDPVTITVMDYDPDGNLTELCTRDPEIISRYRTSTSTTWIAVDGIHDTDVVRMIGDLFGIHPLTLEDLMNSTQRPKFEEYPDYIFIIQRMISRSGGEIGSRQVALIITETCLLTFLEKPGDIFDPVRKRIRSRGKITKAGPDFLCYALIDTIVDEYFEVLELLGEEIEVLEDTLIQHPDPDSIVMIRRLKRDLIALRKAIWPQREVLSALQRTESSLVSQKIGIYLRDVYDHTIQVIDAVETLRDLTAGMLDLYLSTISYRMNEVMKVLTIIATIFIPLTFIAGVYGMNFAYMPELELTIGYPATLLLMFAVSIMMLFYFRKKRWI
ncbi:MAG: magnesium and cobalt transport protein CorA [Methanocalculus sp. MSAO_Arc1]|uniref:magnesium/cobalt transporter CorA n=1 Tax=Methanocalculus TaxID=71151 RepID=UPI000FF405DF|nr:MULTISPECIES: magnesium/cobalt transporter CorA [unclassified Methanocalculus]MCP1662257.1 magnesium transporter [Methanocalculus sp. AMF5]RQD81711.1 MAG: magnesium and cobalt transport protein CorA [Methanocalculus sp. MSAO_Arc1]